MMFRDYTVSGEVKDGRLELTDREGFSRAMRHFTPGPVTVRIERDRGRRSSQQNRYYRLVLGLISEDTGDEIDDLHEFFKRKFLAPNIVAVLGQEIEVYTTTRENYDDFWQYVEQIRRFALVERGIVTPDPDPALRGRAKRRAA